jgi:hypothetical protein
VDASSCTTSSWALSEFIRAALLVIIKDGVESSSSRLPPASISIASLLCPTGLLAAFRQRVASVGPWSLSCVGRWTLPSVSNLVILSVFTSTCDHCETALKDLEFISEPLLNNSLEGGTVMLVNDSESESDSYAQEIKQKKNESEKNKRPDQIIKLSDDETSYIIRSRRAPGYEGVSFPNELECDQKIISASGRILFFL